MLEKIKTGIAWFFATMVVVGLAIQINEYLGMAALALMILIPIVLWLKSPDPFGKNKAAFAKEMAEKAKAIPGFSQRDDIAVVFDMDTYASEVRALQLQSKELYEEEERLWASSGYGQAHFWSHKLEKGQQLQRQAYNLSKAESDKLKTIVQACARAMGPDYVGFVHFSFQPTGGYGYTSSTYNVSFNDGTSSRVTVSSGGGAHFGPLGIVCHRSYYAGYKKHIHTSMDSHGYTVKKDKYRKAQAQGQRQW